MALQSQTSDVENWRMLEMTVTQKCWEVQKNITLNDKKKF